MSTREIITVQLGNYANFVGAHVWNLQQTCFSYNRNDSRIPLEFNHDIFFREGKSPRGQVTYTPRLVVADLPGSLGHLKNDLYDPPPSAKEQISWSGKVTIHKTEPVPKSSSSHSRDQSSRSFSSDEDKDICRADLTSVGGASEIPPPDNLARHWTDFLKVDFHPKTVNLVHGYHHNSRDDPFDLYGQGVQCYEDSAWQEGFLDGLRWFAEDSDSLQAFSVVLDAHDGFSGLAGGLLEHLGDDYPSKATLCWPLFQPHYRALKEGAAATERAHRCFNAVMCYGSLSRLSSGFCPLSVSADHFKGTARTFQHLRLLDQEQYQTSAVLGSALDSFYCGLKLKNQPLDLTQLLGQLTGVGRRMASLSCSFPLGLPENGLLENHSCIPVPLTPGAVADARQDISLAVVRGCPQDLISRLPRSVQDPGEVVHRFADKMCGGGLAWLMRVENPTRTANGFPAIFDEAVTPRGLISKHPREKNTGVALVPSLVCVQSGSGTARGLQEVVHAGSSLDLQRFHRCTLAGTEPDAFKEALNAVQELASDYDLGL
uniref:Putative members of tubulin/ftsz family n=2 Tax=Ixodes ricinus TaxID=34613 RepID=A0A131YBX4_IXORI